MEVTVKHQSIEANWIDPNSINNPKTLVLGSFNPYNTHSDSVDYYYGRESNHFWMYNWHAVNDPRRHQII